MKEKRNPSASFPGRFSSFSFLKRNPSTLWNVPPPPLPVFGPTNLQQMPGQLPFGIGPIIAAGAGINREHCRLYVGNMPNNITTNKMVEFFNQQMYNLGLPPIVGCRLYLEKNFAFLELRSPFETTQALLLDGINMMGKNLKIRRPDKYQPLDMPSDNTASVNRESPNAIYIGAMPDFMTDDQLMELLCPFGKLRSFKHIRDVKTGLSKGFAFCEYEDASITDQVIDALNWLHLGDRKLIVQRASLGAKRAQKATLSVGDRSLSPTEASPDKLRKENVGDNSLEYIKEEGAKHGAKGAEKAALSEEDPILSPTEVLCLHNMVPPDISNIDDDILEDIREECAKHGEVCSVEMVRPIEGKDAPGGGNVFVLFKTALDCQKAREELSKRKFNGRTITTSYFDPNKYKKDQF